jgi:hypothetical protein
MAPAVAGAGWPVSLKREEGNGERGTGKSVIPEFAQQISGISGWPFAPMRIEAIDLEIPGQARDDRRCGGRISDLRPQTFDINHEPILHLALLQPLIGLVDLLHVDHFHVASDVVLGAEVEHFLGFGQTADQ